MSGAGPTVMAITRAEDIGFASSIAPTLSTLYDGREGGFWTRLELRADDVGAVLENY